MQNIKVTGDSWDKVEIIPLGSGNEVGRSCVVCKFKGKQVMFDCGVHPANSGVDSLPFFDTINAEEIDLVLITHFHLDHCGAVPYFLQETGFKGKIVMTHPTKKIFRMVMQDFIRVTSGVHDVCTEAWLEKALEKIETFDYHQEASHNGIKFHSYNAGHVLGAAMWMIEICGVRILYTGDFSRQPDRHLMGAETPVVVPDVLIVESTYGIQVHEPREDREKKFTKWISDVVMRGGRCLLPVFALGRSQELLLILDEYWSEHKELQSIPIYYASSLAKRCNTVFESYIALMNDRIQKQYDVLKHKNNPFVFKHISLLKDIKTFDDSGPCVVLASPGMLQSGVSRQLFERWCTDEKNGVVIAGYCVAGTLARQIQSNPSEVQREDGKVLPLRCSVHTVSFSAHSDFQQTREFVETIGTKHVVLVHGDSMNMSRLRNRLVKDFPYLSCHTPANTQVIKIPFHPQRICKVIGSNTNTTSGNHLKGLMVISKDFQHTLLEPGDLPTYTELTVADISQAVYVPLLKYFSAHDIEEHLSKYFSGVTMLGEDPQITLAVGAEDNEIVLVISGCVHIILHQSDTTTVCIKWRSSRFTDIVADSTCVSLLCLLKPSTQEMPQDAGDDVFRLRCMHKMLSQHFLGVHLHLGERRFTFTVDGESVTVIAPFTIDCDSPAVVAKVRAVTHRIFLSVWPIPEDFGWCGCGEDHQPTKIRAVSSSSVL